MMDNLIIAEIMFSKYNQIQCAPLYASLREMYGTAEDMDVDKDMIMNTMMKGLGDEVFEVVERHRTKNFMLSKTAISKRNRQRSEEDTKAAWVDEQVHHAIMKKTVERYKHMRKYAFAYHSMTENDRTQMFLDEFLELFLKEI
jgi:hypothetical protein